MRLIKSIIKNKNLLIKNVRYCSNVKEKKKNYSSTVFLPKTKLPNYVPKINDLETQLQANPHFFNLYYSQQETNKGSEFILHDGPPYANGDVHLGHAVNKILKDITNRYKISKGFRVDYTPGWDCHGLPIELKAMKSNENPTDPLSIRQNALNLVNHCIERQKESFKRWGVLGNWEKPYQTNNASYIQNQFEKFYELFEKGLIFQSNMPVYWSISNQTSLAEAELEYNEKHISPSIILKMKLTQYPKAVTKYISNLEDFEISALIWTTTPWTIPANQAIGYSPNKMYSLISLKEGSNQLYIVATETIEALQIKFDTKISPLVTFPGGSLNGLTYRHPFYDNDCNFIPGNFIDASKGTGLVHTAPNHGHEDYANFISQNLELNECLVDHTGCYTSKAGELLAGLNVLTEGNETVIKHLGSAVLDREQLVHSYPYDWRSKTPLIIRSSRQWFIDLSQIKAQAVKCLEDVKFMPETGKTQLIKQITSRPPWCISRQRVWGVPIPVFYTEAGKPLINKALIDHLSSLLHKHGPDFWWTLPQDKLITPVLRESLGVHPNDNIIKGEDIMDIWFDSGLSWTSVLGDEKIADLYIEGVDQLRGWFQSSLLTSVALRGKAPYKNVYIHGFTLDKDGHKMSKSLGNVVVPDDIINGVDGKSAYGADNLRWWVAKHVTDHTNSKVKENIFQECKEETHKIRILMRFLLGSLNDFSFEQNGSVWKDLTLVDKHMLNTLTHFIKKLDEDYDAMKYNSVILKLLNFITNDVSGFYCHNIKYRLYCLKENDPKRRSCQTVLYHLLKNLVKPLAPIIPHFADELLQHLPFEDLNISKVNWGSMPEEWSNLDALEAISSVLQVRDAINASFDPGFKRNLDVTIKAKELMYSNLEQLQPNEKTSTESLLCELLQASKVTLSHSDDLTINKPLENDEMFVENYNFSLIFHKALNHLCPRCRRHTSEEEKCVCGPCQENIAHS